jgi:hypothetical protein
MGQWGTGLYANDLGLDLRSVVGGVLRLPLEVDSVLEQLVETQPVLRKPDDPEYTDAWLVVADRLHRYGLRHEPTLTLVRHLIDDDIDILRKAELGFDERELQARRKVLAELRTRLETPHPKPYRTGTIKKPQPYVLDSGLIVSYPAMDGACANPYYSGGDPRFRPDGFGAALVAERGRIFGYLTWYIVFVLDATWPRRPLLADCLPVPVAGPGTGTLSRSHLHRIGIEPVATIDADPESHIPAWARAQARNAAVGDRSLGNDLRRPVHGRGARPSGHELRDLLRKRS